MSTRQNCRRCAILFRFVDVNNNSNRWAPLRWFAWSILSAILLVSDVFYYIKQVETELVGSDLFLALAVTHLFLCIWGYRNMVQDQHSSIANIAGKSLIFLYVVLVFSSSTFDLIGRAAHFSAIALFLAAMAVIRMKKYFIK